MIDISLLLWQHYQTRRNISDIRLHLITRDFQRDMSTLGARHVEANIIRIGSDARAKIRRHYSNTEKGA